MIADTGSEFVGLFGLIVGILGLVPGHHVVNFPLFSAVEVR